MNNDTRNFGRRVGYRFHRASALGLFLAVLVSTAVYAGPAIMSPAPVHDFGQLDNEQKVEHEFVVKNVGDEPLVISDVKTSCGCTVAKLAVNTLAPGEETTISASLNLKGKQGVQSKKITVMSNDTEQPNYYLEFKGVSTSTIMMEPNLLNLGRIMDNEPHSQSVNLKSMKEGHEFKIENVVVEEPAQVSTEVVEVVPGKEYNIVATTKPNLAEGSMNGRITITTDDPDRRVMIVRLYGHVVGELQLRPETIVIRSSGDADARKASQFLQILPGRTKEFELLEVIAPVEGMVAEIIKRQDNDYHIRLAEMPVDNSLKDKELIITTNLPEKPEIRIPFNVIPAAPIQVGRTPSRVPVARPRPVAAPEAPVPAPAATN